jgi:hypothetical protein
MSDVFGEEINKIRAVASSLGGSPAQADFVASSGLAVSVEWESVISRTGTALRQSFFGASRGSILYLPLGRYALPAPGALADRYDLPVKLQRDFALCARLRPDANVDLLSSIDGDRHSGVAL